MPPDIARRVDRRQPAYRSALPLAPFLPRKNSAGLFGERKPDDDKEEDAGILAYVKDDDAVSADFRCRKACVSLLNEGIHINYTFQTASRADHCDPRGFVQEEIMKKM